MAGNGDIDDQFNTIPIPAPPVRTSGGSHDTPWNVESLRQSVDAQMHGGWTFPTLVVYINASFTSSIRHIEALIHGHDRRYEERYIASQTALRDALLAAQTAVNAALTAAKEAVLKAEAAADKRFEGVNELRGMAQDFQTLAMPRIEGEQRIQSVQERGEAADKGILGRLESLSKEVADLRESRSEGAGAHGQRMDSASNSRAERGLAQQTVAIAVAIILGAASIAVTIIIATHR